MKNKLTLALATIIFSGSIMVANADTHNYKITIDGVEKSTSSDSDDIHEILKTQNIEVSNFDRVEKGDNIVTINKARPVLIRDGKSAYYRFTTFLDAKDIAKEQKIELGENDEISKTDNTLIITRVKKETRTTTKEVPFETKTVSDPTTTETTTTGGVPGEKTVIEEVTYKNGDKVGSVVINETVTKQPKHKVITKGTKTQEYQLSSSVRLPNGNTAGSIGAQAAREMEKRTGVSSTTWETIIARESNGRLDAYNPSGARGLFQTMPGWGPTNTLEQQLDAATRAYNAQGLSAWGM